MRVVGLLRGVLPFQLPLHTDRTHSLDIERCEENGRFHFTTPLILDSDPAIRLRITASQQPPPHTPTTHKNTNPQKPQPSPTIAASYLTSTTGTRSTSTGMGVSGERILHVRTVRAFRWPTIALSLLLFVLFICAAITVGTYSYFAYVQGRLLVLVPW